MRVTKAVITAAAPNQNTIPLQRLVDREGVEATALELIIEETLSAGIEEICVVIRPGDGPAYEIAAGEHLSKVRFVEQPQPLGYADAIRQATDFVAGQPFLHLVGDHLHISGTGQRCAEQLVRVASEFGCSVSAVQSTRENKLPYFGIVAGTNVPRYEGLYEISRVIEKPTPTLAEQELITAGLRSGHYLGFFGMHVLTPGVLDAIHQIAQSAESDPAATAGSGASATGPATGGGSTPIPKPSLSDALAMLPTRERYLAYRVNGSRYNIGIQYGLLMAQMALALSGRDRDLVLTELLELVAYRPGNGGQWAESIERDRATRGQS
jgi:UTP--glucose-1-phosphate uridylyltransferase